MPNREEILEALKTVIDPELGINIVDLGLVSEIFVEPSSVVVHFMTTTHACPLGDLIKAEIQKVVADKLPATCSVIVIQDTDVSWNKDRLSDAAKKTLG